MALWAKVENRVYQAHVLVLPFKHVNIVIKKLRGTVYKALEITLPIKRLLALANI